MTFKIIKNKHMKNLQLTTILVLIILLSFQTVFSQNKTHKNCGELVRYRDNGLYNDFVKAQNKYIIKKSALDEFKKQRAELDNLSFTNTTKTFAQALMIVKAACDLSKNILGMIPGAKAVTKSEKIAFFTSDLIEKKFIEGKDVKTIAIEVAEGQMKSKIYDVLPSAFEASDAIYSYYKQIKDINKFTDEANEFLENVKTQMQQFDETINLYQQRVNNEQEKLSQINEIKTAIDKYCGQKPIVKIIADMDCNISVDFGTKTYIAKNANKEFSLEKGEHGAGKPTSKRIEEAADIYSFIYDNINKEPYK